MFYFFRPSYELATQYLSEWFRLGVEEAERLGYRVIDISGEAATPENLVNALGSYDFAALFLGGHGNVNVFTGQNGQVVFKACQNDQVLAGNIAYYLSCYVAQELGVSNVDKGLIAFLGYNTDFRFAVDTSYSILEDPSAEPFKDMVFEVVSRVLRGQRIREVWEGGIAKCNEWVSKLGTRSGTQWAQVISFVEHDRDGFVALGNDAVYSYRPRTPFLFGFAPMAVGIGLSMVVARRK